MTALPQSKAWCFTLNNFTNEDEAFIASNVNEFQYLLYGKEVGTAGTPHLQGVVLFRARKRYTTVKAFISPRSHVEICRDVNASIGYCKKDGNIVELGVLPLSKVGKRNDLEAFKADVKKGKRDMSVLMEDHSLILAKYYRFALDYIALHAPVVPPKQVFPLRDWQQSLYERLVLAADDRTIIFAVDLQGNKGKSWFARYFTYLHPKISQIIIPGKKADMAYLLKTECSVLFFDTPRSKQGEYIQYDFLEEIKNGFVFSPKYQSTMKMYAHNVHVVVLMNEYPDMHKLSADRYLIIEL